VAAGKVMREMEGYGGHNIVRWNEICLIVSSFLSYDLRCREVILQGYGAILTPQSFMMYDEK
jgi:hypothetical protein